MENNNLRENALTLLTAFEYPSEMTGEELRGELHAIVSVTSTAALLGLALEVGYDAHNDGNIPEYIEQYLVGFIDRETAKHLRADAVRRIAKAMHEDCGGVSGAVKVALAAGYADFEEVMREAVALCDEFAGVTPTVAPNVALEEPVSPFAVRAGTTEIGGWRWELSEPLDGSDVAVTADIEGIGMAVYVEGRRVLAHPDLDHVGIMRAAGYEVSE